MAWDCLRGWLRSCAQLLHFKIIKIEVKMFKNKKMPRAVIFDQDGLLFDTEAVFERCWIAEGLKNGLELKKEFIYGLCGLGRKDLASAIAKEFPGVDGTSFVERVHHAAAEAQLAMTPVMKKGVREILEFCRARGLKTAVASSSMRHLVDHNLAATNLTEYFDAIVTGKDVENGKPAPDIFLLAAERIGVPADECIVFEDSINGIKAACAAASTAIMIPDRAQPTPEIRAICTVFPSLLDACEALSAL